MTTRGLTRRAFLRATGAAALTLGLANLDFALRCRCGAGEPPARLPPLPPYRTWEDVYRAASGPGIASRAARTR